MPDPTGSALWRGGSGTIRRPALKDMLFLPQRPYMILGTLRHQLSYPNVEAVIADEQLVDVMKRVNLEHLVERCGGFDTELDFAKLLSERMKPAPCLLPYSDIGAPCFRSRSEIGTRQTAPRK